MTRVTSPPTSRRNTGAKPPPPEDRPDEKPVPGPAAEEQRDGKTTTKVRAALIWKAKTVAAYRHLDLFDYLDQLLTPLIDREFSETVRDRKGE